MPHLVLCEFQKAWSNQDKDINQLRVCALTDDLSHFSSLLFFSLDLIKIFIFYSCYKTKLTNCLHSFLMIQTKELNMKKSNWTINLEKRNIIKQRIHFIIVDTFPWNQTDRMSALLICVLISSDWLDTNRNFNQKKMI